MMKKFVLNAPTCIHTEEVESYFGYYSQYEPLSIDKQLFQLHKFFPEIATIMKKNIFTSIPHGAEGWFVIPKWERIAENYQEAIFKIFQILKIEREGRFLNLIENKLNNDHLRQSDKTRKIHLMRGFQLNNDIDCIPAQFGLRHRGRSVQMTCAKMSKNEFGLDSFTVGIMLLTHPKRLIGDKDLWCVCAGDEFSFNTPNSYSFTPFFCFKDHEIRYGIRNNRRSFEYHSGICSGFTLASGLMLTDL